MADIKPLSKISNRWIRVSQVSQAEYEDGVKNPRRSWKDSTLAAESSYNKGVQQAISRKSFKAGVERAGDEKWQQGALNKGVSRWSEGIRLAQDNYEKGFAPYRAVIQNTELPARGPKGDPANIQRVATMADALHKEKISRSQG